MKPKTIGIIGGAGPFAGAFLLERVLSLSSKKYGCYRDSDFPKIILISFPFSEMLSSLIDSAKLRKELIECLTQLRSNGATVLAIACNTLHLFLDESDECEDLIHLPRTLVAEIPQNENPLVFCTSTSARLGLHKQFFSCEYPDSQTQKEVDNIIDHVLKGTETKIVVQKLEKILQAQATNTVILGCTELSLLTDHLHVPNKSIIDPLEVAVNKILEKSFLK